MDFQGIEALLGLPEFRVIAQVCGPQQLDLHLQRRDDHLVCPRCQAYCSHVKESRPRCLRDLPILEHPVILWLHMRRFQCTDCHHRPWETSETFGARVQWTERLYHQVRQEFLRGCPCKELARRYGLSERGIHVTRDRVASVRYSERLNSSKSSFSFQRTDRYGIVGQKHSHFQRDS